MAIATATVTNSIEALTVTGLTIYDVDNIPSAVDVRQTAALLPLPNFVTGMSVERDSFGADQAKMTVVYTLNYRLCYAPAGAGRNNVIEFYDGMVDMVAAIWDEVLAISTFAGAVNIFPTGVANMGVVLDPAGVGYFGCDLSFEVTEFVN